jgi:murein DD-endopeptidase MepM/ murein hydrolase activator NlpD
MATDTTRLITDLAHMDEDEALIHGRLLRQLETLEELEARKRSVTVGDLDVLQTAVGDLQVKLSAARAAAATPATPTFAQLEAQVREHDATAQRVRELLAERLKQLAPPVASSDESGHDGHATTRPGVPQTFRLQQPLLKGDDVRAFQRLLNHRYAAWGVRRRIAENGVYGPETAEAARQVVLGLGLLKTEYEHGISPALRVVIRQPERRTDRQKQRALSAERRAYRAALRKRYAHTKHAGAAGTNGNGGGPAVGGGIAAAIRANGGHYEREIVLEATRYGVPVSLVCAVMEQESNFRNVFGHDPVDNPIKSPKDGLLFVTEELYRKYLSFRTGPKTSQGVGPMQLTYPTLQDEADDLGGCFDPAINIRVGVKNLARLIHKLGERDGVQAYNGAPGHGYADSVLGLKHDWDVKLAGAKGPSHGPQKEPSKGPSGTHPGTAHPGTAHPGAPRRFTLAGRPRGADVRRFQRELNAQFKAMRIGRRIAVDGIYGVETARAARQIALALGLLASDYERGITPHLRVLIRTPSRRSPAQKQRATSAQRRQYRARLRKRYGAVHPGATPQAGATPAAVVPGGAMGYPLARRGTFNGGPGVGTHSFTAAPNNWQSDNAIDLTIPVGSPMLAVEAGVVTQVTLHPQDGGRFAGDGITILGDGGNRYFYKHGVASVKAKQRVSRGQQIGTSGSAAGSPHLHFAVEHGDPRKVIGQSS